MDGTTRAWLLAQLGDDTDLVDLETRYTRLGTARATAIEVLYGRKAALLASPTVVGVSAVVSVNYTGNVAALERQIAALESGQPPAPGEPGYGEPPAADASQFGIIQLHAGPRR